MSTPEFIVNAHGELGVRVNEENFFIYKGLPFVYTEGAGTVWRPVEKREFGESGPCLREESEWDVADWPEVPDDSQVNLEELMNNLPGNGWQIDGPTPEADRPET